MIDSSKAEKYLTTIRDDLVKKIDMLQVQKREIDKQINALGLAVVDINNIFISDDLVDFQ